MEEKGGDIGMGGGEKDRRREGIIGGTNDTMYGSGIGAQVEGQTGCATVTLQRLVLIFSIFIR